LNKKYVKFPAGCKVDEISILTPNNFVIRVEEKVNKMVKVIPKLTSPHKIKVFPPLVKVMGSRSTLARISHISTEEINAIQPPETLYVNLICPEGVRILPDSVKIVIESTL
jgi:YbbR domain-containing protein